MVRSTARARMRMAGAALVVLLLSATALAGCEWPDGTRYVDQVFADITTTTDVAYRTATNSVGETVQLELDIYQPQGDTAAKRPVVMWMFGGYWAVGNKEQMTTFAQDSARRGYVGVSIDYRIRPDAVQNPVAAAYDAYDDAVAAVQWLKDHAATYKIDPGAIVAAGYSAGAINAQHLLFLPPNRGPATSPIAGAVSISGFAFGAPTGPRPPLITFNGTEDDLVNPATAEAICDRSREQGNVCRFVSEPGQGHVFDSALIPGIRDQAHHFLMDFVLLPKGYSGAV